MYWLYILIALFATTFGSISGMGGGVIMKPLFDLINDYNATQIAVMTSCTVFVMSLVSVALAAPKMKNEKLNAGAIAVLIVGSLGGGYLGEALFKALTSNAADEIVKIVQNAVLIVIIAFIIVYMSKKDNKKTLNSTSKIAALLVGLVLGILSSFLGIGGGPMNVALIVFVFGYGIKIAVFCSLATIVFAQAAKLVTVVATLGTAAFAIDLLPFVIVTGVIGALIGKAINKRLSDEGVNRCFLAVQILVVVLCAVNIVRFSIAA